MNCEEKSNEGHTATAHGLKLILETVTVNVVRVTSMTGTSWSVQYPASESMKKFQTPDVLYLELCKKLTFNPTNMGQYYLRLKYENGAFTSLKGSRRQFDLSTYNNSSSTPSLEIVKNASDGKPERVKKTFKIVFLTNPKMVKHVGDLKTQLATVSKQMVSHTQKEQAAERERQAHQRKINRQTSTHQRQVRQLEQKINQQSSAHQRKVRQLEQQLRIQRQKVRQMEASRTMVATNTPRFNSGQLVGGTKGIHATAKMSNGGRTITATSCQSGGQVSFVEGTLRRSSSGMIRRLEFKFQDISGSFYRVGFVQENQADKMMSQSGQEGSIGAVPGSWGYKYDGTKFNGNTTPVKYGCGWNNKTILATVDFMQGTISFTVDGVDQGVAFTGVSGPLLACVQICCSGSATISKIY